MSLTKNKKFIISSIVLLAIVFGGVLYATTFKYLYTSEVEIASTNAYGGATDDLAADGAYDYTSDIDLETNGYYGVWLSLEYDSSGTTDNIILSYFASYDGSTFENAQLHQVNEGMSDPEKVRIAALLESFDKSSKKQEEDDISAECGIINENIYRLELQNLGYKGNYLEWYVTLIKKAMQETT